MKTSTVEVGELVSTVSAAGVGRQLLTLPGVHHADVNYVAGSATVHYDESRTSLEAIRQRVIDCGYHCRGELVPAHVCEPADHDAAGAAPEGHAGHVMPGGASGQGTGIDPGPKALTRPGHDVHAGHGDQGSDAGPRDSSAHQVSDMMHDMDRAPGMSMQDMARDMRNRFLVALVFAVPVFLYSPMGEMFGDFPTPLGLDRRLFVFVVATGAIAYPVWPFLVAAWRAARNKVAPIADRNLGQLVRS